MKDTEAKVLDGCTIAAFLENFGGSPTAEARRAFSVWREIMMADWKRLQLQSIRERLMQIIRYKPTRAARIAAISGDISEMEGAAVEVNREGFNSFVISVFAAAMMPVDKRLSMLDLYTIYQKVKR